MAQQMLIEGEKRWQVSPADAETVLRITGRDSKLNFEAARRLLAMGCKSGESITGCEHRATEEQGRARIGEVARGGFGAAELALEACSLGCVPALEALSRGGHVLSGGLSGRV